MTMRQFVALSLCFAGAAVWVVLRVAAWYGDSSAAAAAAGRDATLAAVALGYAESDEAAMSAARMVPAPPTPPPPPPATAADAPPPAPPSRVVVMLTRDGSSATGPASAVGAHGRGRASSWATLAYQTADAGAPRHFDPWGREAAGVLAFVTRHYDALPARRQQKNRSTRGGPEFKPPSFWS